LDSYNAERFAAENYGRVRWNAPAHCWELWNGFEWERDQVGYVQYRARLLAAAIFDEAMRSDDRRLRRFAIKTSKPSRLKAMVAAAAPLLAVDAPPRAKPSDDFDLLRTVSPYRSWFESACERSNGAFSSTGELFESLMRWATDNDYECLTKRAMSEWLAGHGCDHSKYRQVRGFRGVRLKNGPKPSPSLDRYSLRLVSEDKGSAP
jgi:hypothetical protein